MVGDFGKLTAVRHRGARLDAPIVADHELVGCFRLRSHHGTWLGVQEDAPRDKEVRMRKAPDTERQTDVWFFYKYGSGGNEYGLCNYHTHRFMSFEPCEWATCNRKVPDTWERLQLHEQGGKVAFLCRKGPKGPRWLTVESNRCVRTDRLVADAWEKFDLIPVEEVCGDLPSEGIRLAKAQ
ncbi:hypothetical protein GPECTOR_26g503 [Gonium pectorale]|uniref:Uncharacterized protein n=1 Tax=Gonium pectorale TaxID=33097 RepID=A0A150GGV2_GONPE|nr:hypothetical protein GPECTOR_26g503 [Gonium pectorale]|eukprot:KXZ48600.1 hypothetical protein GPECTOR_26g503 [Gonium pectorale]